MSIIWHFFVCSFLRLESSFIALYLNRHKGFCFYQQWYRWLETFEMHLKRVPELRWFWTSSWNYDWHKYESHLIFCSNLFAQFDGGRMEKIPGNRRNSEWTEEWSAIGRFIPIASSSEAHSGKTCCIVVCDHQSLVCVYRQCWWMNKW